MAKVLVVYPGARKVINCLKFIVSWAITRSLPCSPHHCTGGIRTSLFQKRSLDAFSTCTDLDLDDDKDDEERLHQQQIKCLSQFYEVSPSLGISSFPCEFYCKSFITPAPPSAGGKAYLMHSPILMSQWCCVGKILCLVIYRIQSRPVHLQKRHFRDFTNPCCAHPSIHPSSNNPQRK